MTLSQLVIISLVPTRSNGRRRYIAGIRHSHEEAARWLAEHNYVPGPETWLWQSSKEPMRRAFLYDLTTGRHEPHDSDIEGRFSITKVEPQGSGPPETSRSPQLSADFVADVGDQKGEAAEAIS